MEDRIGFQGIKAGYGESEKSVPYSSISHQSFELLHDGDNDHLDLC
ncbi:hypothetical protein BAZSYMB_GCONTIG00707_0 [Bathymodiolus azoricus thioautotrophic gill symbiont]|uniref:Uncharacterized protein n=1 Tax=Bathymodiolus azoricus thioautotrophic gill symbiont TaxID=235205 RepID=A0A1H6MCH9_9GAMM|nr:hypothetical protein BAZSYMB_GCONTIG00707_0 [Bathymodiolus azoricus thioautotrophic gill symbiont]